MDSSDHEESKKIGQGEVVKATKSRNWMFHKKAFALLNLGHQNQDKYEDFEVYRKIITIRAGFYDEVQDKNGDTHYIPKSLSYDKMKAEEFDRWYNQTLDVIASDLDSSSDEIRGEVEGYY